jgi:hypothetical protein
MMGKRKNFPPAGSFPERARDTAIIRACLEAQPQTLDLVGTLAILVFAVNPPIGDPPLQGGLGATEPAANFTPFLEGQVFRQVQANCGRVRQKV